MKLRVFCAAVAMITMSNSAYAYSYIFPVYTINSVVETVIYTATGENSSTRTVYKTNEAVRFAPAGGGSDYGISFLIEPSGITLQYSNNYGVYVSINFIATGYQSDYFLLPYFDGLISGSYYANPIFRLGKNTYYYGQIESISTQFFDTPLDMPILSVSSTPVPSFAPEPATWLMMVVGFGAIGGVMRRRPQGCIPNSRRCA